MGKLFPPIVESTIPAFYGNSITVPYSLNRAVGKRDVQGFSLIVKSTITGNPLFNKQTTVVTDNNIIFGFTAEEAKKLSIGSFYKVQIAFIGDNQEIGYYSDAATVKYLGEDPPKLTIEDNLALADSFTGIYTCNDISEKMNTYIFNLYDYEDNLVDTSGEQLHNSINDVLVDQQDTWSPNIGLNNNFLYKLEFKVITVNGFELSTSRTIAAKKDSEGYTPFGIRLITNYNEENGYVELKLSSAIQNDTRNLIYGRFYIFKTSSKDNYKTKEKIAYFKLENQDLYEKIFKDFTVESGYEYRYILQQINDYGFFSEEIFSCTEEVQLDGSIRLKQEPIKVAYEHMYLFDGEKQLKIKYNPKVSSFKNTIQETKVDTIGSKYPFIFRNNNVHYKELNISGLISYLMDEENLFISKDELFTYPSDYSNQDLYASHYLSNTNITTEKIFKLKVLEWLNNGEPKLFKSPTEGNYIVRLMNVSLSPNDTLGRMLHTFTATGYEVEDANKHDFCQAIAFDRTGKHIGYRTIVLETFPEKRIIYNENNQYTILKDNTLYEIIGNTALEYVVAVRFEDIKPGTQFKITMERNLETIIQTIRIGATGFYRIPRELGFHITSIRLTEPDWNTNDPGFDIMNNKGQITYEYEQQAKHCNFNDIKNITSDIAVGEPWYSSWYNVTVKEPIVNSEGKNLYRYKKNSATVDAFIEIAYFYNEEKKTAIGPYINGKDYYIDEQSKYRDMKTKSELKLLTEDMKDNEGNFLIEQYCCYYQYLDPLYKYVQNQYLSGVQEGQITDNFQWENSTYTASNNPTVYYQIYEQNPQSYYYKYIDEENKGHFYQASSNSGANLKYQKLETGKTVNLFIPVWNTQGNQIYDQVTNLNGIYRNPFYSKLEYFISSNSYTDTIPVNIYSLELLNTIDDLGSFTGGTTDTIYRNFVPSKYYNQKNITGEYYDKEDIKNIFQMNFELIQVFYQEDLNKTQNFEYEGSVQYEDLEEDAGYQYTQRMITGIPQTEDSPTLINPNDEMFVDKIIYDKELYNYVKGKTYILINENTVKEQDLDVFNKLFDTNFTSVNEITAKNLYDEGIDIYQKSSKITFNNGDNGYAMVKVTSRPTKTKTDIDYYINLLGQLQKKYSQITTPEPNEVILVYDNNLNNPVRIDLTNRFSYSITAEDEVYGFRNLEGVYIGKNVRGFATYRRKKYDYHALITDNVWVDLEA